MLKPINEGYEINHTHIECKTLKIKFFIRVVYIKTCFVFCIFISGSFHFVLIKIVFLILIIKNIIEYYNDLRI